MAGTAPSAPTATAPASARLIDAIASRLPGVGRRSFLVGSAVAGSALVADPKGYALRPVRAYDSICGPGNTASSGWTVFCATINSGRNACPEGSFAAGWWKAAGSSWCGGRYRYIVDCNARCTGCTSGCSDGICNSGCWNCSCGTGSSATCDRRRICCNAFRYGQCNTQVSCSGGVHCRVVSCTPPYEWENCTTTSLVDNRTSEHSTSRLPQWGPIAARYYAMGEQKSYLGYSIGPVRSVGVGNGTFVSYSGGRIYDRGNRTGIAVTQDVVRAMATVGSVPTLGYPVAHEWKGSTGSVQRFQKGAVAAAAGATLRVVHGKAYELWTDLDRGAGPLGYPTGGRSKVLNSGYQQRFEGGAICQNWSGGDARYVTGVHHEKWAALGRATGTLGPPATNPLTTSRGSRQRFYEGQTWAIGNGPAYAVLEPVLAAWLRERGHVGRYGYPVSDTVQRSDGRWQCTFEGGTLVV